MTIARDPKRTGPKVHPGEILLEEFLRPLSLSQVALARHLGVPLARVNEIIKGKRGITAETAWLFAEAFGTSPQFWLNLQTNYELSTNRPARHVARIKRAS
jgi:antitoxin HigA-1